jgi:hypothetical protein
LLADGMERIAELFCSEESWKYWHSFAKMLPSSVPNYPPPGISPKKMLKKQVALRG